MAQHTVSPQSPGLIIKCNEIKINKVIKKLNIFDVL